MATKYYAVKVGRTTGIFETWDQCKASVNGYPGALYKSFKTKTEAYNYMGWNGEQMDIFNMNTFDQNDTTPIENEKPVDNDIPLSVAQKLWPMLTEALTQLQRFLDMVSFYL